MLQSFGDWRPEREGQVAVRGAWTGTPDPGGVQACEGEADGSACQVPRARGDVVEIAVRRGRSPAQCASQVATPEDHDHPAGQGERQAAQGREGGEGRQGGGGRSACEASRRPQDVVEEALGHGLRVAQSPAQVAAPEVCDQFAGWGECPAAQGRQGSAAPDRGAGSPTCQAAFDRGRAVEEAVRSQERAAGQAALKAPARPAARRARPRPHPRARARGARRSAQAAAGCVHLRPLRAVLRAERRRGIHPRRERGQGPQARDQPPALAPDLRVRVLADRGLGAAGAAVVPRHALRNHLLGALCVRTVRLPAPGAPHRGMDVGPGAGGLAGDAGQQPEALRAAVPASIRGDPRAPERGDPALRRRDLLARAGVGRGRPVEPGLAVDFGQR